MFHPLLVGCPIWLREWAMPHWFAAVESACFQAHVEPAYIFVCDPRDPTTDLIQDLAATYDRPLFMEWIEEDPDLTTKRCWNPERFQRMVYLRNRLLCQVRELRPAFFLSLDSDIILHPDALVSMVEHVDDYAAVGGKVYMTPKDRVAPSYGMIGSHWLRRPDSTQVIEVDAIMAIKLMGYAAYQVDYEFHTMGEDIGWSLACRRAGLRLGWDGRVTNKHVMKPEWVERVDERCGF